MAGARTEFTLEGAELGELQRVVASHDNGGSAPAWYLESVAVEEVATGRTWQCHFGGWVDKPSNNCVAELRPGGGPAGDARTRYRVSVRTGARRGAGTSARVKMRLYGAKGDTGALPLESKHDDFAEGVTDVFTVDAPDVGEMSSLHIAHDNSGLQPSWRAPLPPPPLQPHAAPTAHNRPRVHPRSGSWRMFAWRT